MNNTLQSSVVGTLSHAAVFALSLVVMLVITVAIIGLYVKFSPTANHYRQISTMGDIEIPEPIMREAVGAGQLMTFTPDSDSDEVRTMAFGDPTNSPFASQFAHVKRRNYVIGDDYILVNRPGRTPLVFTNARIE